MRRLSQLAIEMATAARGFLTDEQTRYNPFPISARANLTYANASIALTFAEDIPIHGNGIADIRFGMVPSGDVTAWDARLQPLLEAPAHMEMRVSWESHIA